MRSLVSPQYLARGTGGWSVLLHGHHDATYADDGVTYGDYYLGQALLRLQLRAGVGDGAHGRCHLLSV